MRFSGPLPPDLLRSYEEEYRAQPKRAFVGPKTLAFDGADRLWYATSRDSDDFSYLDVWVGTGYAGIAHLSMGVVGTFPAAVPSDVGRVRPRRSAAVHGCGWLGCPANRQCPH